MKRTIKCLLALVLVWALAIPQGIHAAGTLTVTTVSGEAGQQVVVEVRLIGDDVCSGGFDVRFDSDKLQLVSAQKGDGSWFGAVNEKEDGLVRVSFAQATPLTEAVLCRLMFNVTENTPAGGTDITLGSVRLYDEEAKSVDATLVFGKVSRDCVWFSLKNAETVAGQGVRAEIHMSGTKLPCGGNFALRYDSETLCATGVLALEGLDGSRMTYHLEDGVVRIAFAGEQPVGSGALCAVIFRAVGKAGSSADVTLTDVRAYDEDSQSMGTEVTSGRIQVVVPTEEDPKLWVVGGSLNEDGEAVASVVLQGRGRVCGGQFSLLYDSSMTVDVTAEDGVEFRQEAGAIHVSWAQETPMADAKTLITVAVSDGVESALSFDSNVRMYDGDSTLIGVVDIRNGAVTAAEQIHLTVDEVTVEPSGKGMEVTATVDLADAAFFTDAPAESVMPMLALYQDGRLVGIATDPAVRFHDGVAEVSLTAKSKTAVTDYAVFIAGDGAPLCAAVWGE